MEINDTWKAGEGEIDGTPFIIRYRPHLQNFVDTGKYTHRMEMVWLYNSPNPALMPDEEEYELMKQVEDKLAGSFEKDNLAVLAFVYTGHNQNVWHWYTHDIKAAGVRMNESLEGWDELALELYVEEDPEWAEYLSMLDAAVEEDEEEEDEEEEENFNN